MELASIIINSCLSVIAIVISIITIIRQTKEQKLQNTIQLYDKRSNIFCYLMDVYKMSGYLAGLYGLDDKKPFEEPYEKVKVAIHTRKIDRDIYEKILDMRDDADKMSNLTMGLFEKELSSLMCTLMRDFSNFVAVIKKIRGGNTLFSQDHYKVFQRLYKTVITYKVDGFNEKINKYISLVDIKRD